MNVIHYRKQMDDEPALGRPRLYDDEQRKQRHREAALRHYYKRKAAKAPCHFFEQGTADREAMRSPKLCTELSTENTEFVHSKSRAFIGNS